MGVANFVCHSDNTDGFAAPCVLEIEDMESTDRIINIGQYDSSQNSRVISSEGISYAVVNGHKDGMPKITQEAINTDANGNAKAIRACYGQCGYDSVFRGTGQGITGVMEEVEPKIVGYSRSREDSGKVTNRHLKDVANTLHTSTGNGGNTDQYVAEPLIAASRGRGEGWKQQLEVNGSGTSNAITSVAKDNLVMEPNVLRQERTDECKKLRRMNGDKGMKFNGGNKMFAPRTDGMVNTLTSSVKDNILAFPELRMEDGCFVDKDGKRYRIRKLTPRECFRLMNVKDEDIDKMMNAGIAKTNLYKLAGNSIVVAPMYHIFRKLFVEQGNENQQLELF